MKSEILARPSVPKDDSSLVDKPRITKKQALFIRNMCDQISTFLDNHPIGFTEARAHRLIEALKPSYEAIMRLRKQQEEIYKSLRYGDEEDEDFGDFRARDMKW